MWVSLKNNRMSATLDGRVASWGEAIPSKKTKNNSTKSIAIVHHFLPPRKKKKHLSNEKKTSYFPWNPGLGIIILVYYI